MSPQTMLHTFLFLHLIGLILIAGSTLVDFIMYKQFWKQYMLDKGKGVIIMKAISGLTTLTAIGGVVLILSGVGMMVITKGVFDQFIWFRVKMIVLLFLILNIVLVGRRNKVKLSKAINGSDQRWSGKEESLKRNISNFQSAQIIFLLLIILLSVFKFS